MVSQGGENDQQYARWGQQHHNYDYVDGILGDYHDHGFPHWCDLVYQPKSIVSDGSGGAMVYQWANKR